MPCRLSLIGANAVPRQPKSYAPIMATARQNSESLTHTAAPIAREQARTRFKVVDGGAPPAAAAW
jgi:hypothetical protein